MERVFEYEVNLARGQTRIPMKVRAANWNEANSLLTAALPPGWQRREIDFRPEAIREVPVDVRRVLQLEDRVHELEQSLAESNSQVEIEREAAVGMAATINAQADQIGVLGEAFGRRGYALSAIWQLSDDDTAGAAKDAARRILDADPTGFTSIPTETKEV